MTSRTTIRMSPELLRELKHAAAKEGRTVTALIEEAVREAIARRHAKTPRPLPARLPTAGRGGLRPGVDLDDTSSLLDAMDRADAAP
jgi:hypothetical protein